MAELVSPVDPSQVAKGLEGRESLPPVNLASAANLGFWDMFGVKVQVTGLHLGHAAGIPSTRIV
jgi:hypothetical protein